MGARIPNTFATNTAYNTGNVVEFSGVEFRATSNIPNTNTTDPIQDDGANWKAQGVIRIVDAYSLWHDIDLTLNNSAVSNHIWSFIQQADFALNKRLRSPAQIETSTLTLDADSKTAINHLGFVDIDNVRLAGDSSFNYSLRERGKVEILAAQNKADYEQLRQSYNEDFNYTDSYGYLNPVYYIDQQYLYVAPSFPTGTQIEITMKVSEPQLGTTQDVVNANFEPINSANQTVAEWIAAAPANTAQNFVQDTTFIMTNLWISQCPHLLKLGALTYAESFLKDDPRIVVWKAQYQENLQETIDEFYRFEIEQPHNLLMRNPYTF